MPCAQYMYGHGNITTEGISTMSTYQSLLQQKSELDALIAEAQQREKSQAVAQARALIDQYGLNVDDVFGKKSTTGSRAAGARSAVAPKYRDPATGATWTGRGREPVWIKNKDRAAYAI